ncbi:MAG: LPS export ABC transporter periplasmic protein LptC [Lachnospiraceae bacterium]|nr:LPS export ABC transporter periplasmic protein LptC [Lachnospiraceae bacterium]
MNRLTFLLVGASVLVVACSEEKTEVVHREVDGNIVPTMLTHDVVTLISDSGVTRYRITTPVWYVYDEAEVPNWKFPDGMFMEKFAPDFSTDATIVCDSAIYFKNDGLWRLDGNVNILNTAGEKFLTQQVFWNQKEKTVYSDSFIHIEKSDRIIEGYGFESNERMTIYTVNKPAGIFPTSTFKNNKKDSVSSSSSSSDTTVAAAKPHTPGKVPPPVAKPQQQPVPAPRKPAHRPKEKTMPVPLTENVKKY